MPNLANRDQCCGCGACANQCAKRAISMTADEEGFLHPVVDDSKCIECGACENACPALHPLYAENKNPKAYIVQHKEDVIRYQSTSGGAFTAIAEEIIRRGGVVFGATMSENQKIAHGKVESVEELERFRNSKYVQSEIGDCYKEAKTFLVSGRWVCFSGTPCQINGLHKFLGKDYDNLITVDVVCKSVPSPLVFDKYIEYKKAREGNISEVVFRDKKRGFLYCTMAHYLSYEDRRAGKDVYRRGSESDEWLRLFLSGRISRRSCMSCPFQTVKRSSDFSLGDIWETGHVELDDNKGSTLVHVWSEKGRAFFETIKENIRFKDYPFEKSRGAERMNTITLRPDRKKLFEDARIMEPEAFFKRYAPYNAKVKLMQIARYTIWRLNLHNTIRHIKHIIIHRH